MSFPVVKKGFRLFLTGLAGLLLLVAVLLAVAFSSRFQSWYVQRLLADQPSLGVAVGRVDAGLRGIELRDVRIARPGFVVSAPLVQAELPLWRIAISDTVNLQRLTARGWEVDLAGVVNSSPAGSPIPVTAAAAPAGAIEAFAGVFGGLRLPLDVSVERLELVGKLKLPDQRQAAVSVTGGGLGTGREGRFDLAAEATSSDVKVNALQVRGAVLARMDSPRTFTELAVSLDATASGPGLTSPVSLRGGATASRGATGENYSASLITQERQLVAMKAELPRDGTRLDGTWKLNVRDADIEPFALGQALPGFALTGEGKFDTDRQFAAVHAQGRVNGDLGRLEVLRPELRAVGAVKVATEFDATQRGDRVHVQTLEVAFSNAQPIATFRSLQSFEFKPGTAELKPTDANSDMLTVTVHDLPVAWLQPFVQGLTLGGVSARGEFAVASRANGIALRSRTPLVLGRVSVHQGTQPLIRDLDAEVGFTAEYSTQGWQAEIAALRLRDSKGEVLTLNGKAGQLAGIGQPLKATARVGLDFAGALRQPALAGGILLTTGRMDLDLAASVGAKTELQAKIDATGLVSGSEAKPIKLPAASMELRADMGPEGVITLHAPLTLQLDGRKSDLALRGTVGPEKDGARAIDAQVISAHLVVDDAKLLGALLPAEKVAIESGKPSAPKASVPPWRTVHGVVGLQLRKVVYSELFEMTNVTGRLRIDAGAVKLETAQLGLGETGRASGDAALTFHPGEKAPFGLKADFTVRDYNPATLLRGVGGQPTLEGQFDATTRFEGRAPSLDELSSGVAGEVHVTSRSGVFRGVPVNAATLAENTSKLAAWLASAGAALGTLTGKKDYGDVANKAQAIAEIARGLSAIAYDQLSVSLTRDAAQNTTLNNFSLISPELRLTGSGNATHRPGTFWQDDRLALEFVLRARGRQGELLRYVGALDTKLDDLGYAQSTVPLKIGGTISKLDTTELNGKLATLAIEKSGVTEKASELFNRIMGNGK